jgi:hypothetical protein
MSIYCYRATGTLVFILVMFTAGISPVITEADAQKESQKIVLNTISVTYDKNGNRTNISNMSQALQGFGELRKSLDQQTSGGSGKTLGLVANNVTGSIRIENSLNETNTAVVEEARRAGNTGGLSVVIVIDCEWIYYPNVRYHSCIITIWV